MVEGGLIDIIEQGCLDTFVVHNVDRLAKYTCSMDALTHQIMGNRSFITSREAFVKKHVGRILEEVSFENALVQQLTNRGRMQISLPA